MKQTRREFVNTSLAAVVNRALNTPGGELTNLTLSEASEKVRKRAISPVDLTEACLHRIHQLNPKLNAYITVASEQALTCARRAENEPWSGPLHGIPVGIKDIFDTAGIRTTAASKRFENRVPSADAEVVARLRRAGAIIVGKQNLDEFACAGSGIVSHFGPVHNPWNLDYQSGGSSSGSAAAAAAELDFGSVGSDAGGSIRIPAARCGVVGLKPSHGRVSLRGHLSCEWSVTAVGPICRTVADAALLMQVLAGYDPADPISRNEPVPDYTAALGADIRRFRVGVARSLFAERLDSEYAEAFSQAIEVIRGQVAEVRDIELPPVRLSIGFETGADYYAEHEAHL